MEQQYSIKEIDELLSKKVDNAVFSKIVGYGITIIVAVFSLIGGLYILYYSGLSKLETSVAVLNNKVETLTVNVADIQKILLSAQITNEN